MQEEEEVEEEEVKELEVEEEEEKQTYSFLASILLGHSWTRQEERLLSCYTSGRQSPGPTLAA